MKQVFNYFYWPPDPLEDLDTPEKIQAFIKKMGLDGIELLLHKNMGELAKWRELTLGVHLPYYPCWIPMYENDEAMLQRLFPTMEERQKYYEATNREQFLANFASYLELANQLKPRYVVWHVADNTLEEAFTFRFGRTSRQVLAATVRLFKDVIHSLDPEITVLFENLWWPGLDLTSQEDTAFFFEQLEGYNVGIMLDTGHLLNTTLDVHTEKQAIDFLIRAVEKLGPYKSYIKGLHLNLSLSATYRAPFVNGQIKQFAREKVSEHIRSIDQHLPFTNTSLARLIQLIQPQYINHELGYRNTPELESCIKKQLRACGRSSMIENC